jgi:hypothetical protein
MVALLALFVVGANAPVLFAVWSLMARLVYCGRRRVIVSRNAAAALRTRRASMIEIAKVGLKSKSDRMVALLALFVVGTNASVFFTVRGLMARLVDCGRRRVIVAGNTAAARARAFVILIAEAWFKAKWFAMKESLLSSFAIFETHAFSTTALAARRLLADTLKV